MDTSYVSDSSGRNHEAGSTRLDLGRYSDDWIPDVDSYDWIGDGIPNVGPPKSSLETEPL